jgi:hypothetical protein
MRTHRLSPSIHCSFVTSDASRLEREAQVTVELSEWEAQRTAKLRAKSEEALVAMERDPDNLQETYPGELQRRLLESNRHLTAALRDFESTSRTASRWLLAFTVALVVLTVFLVILAWRLES